MNLREGEYRIAKRADACASCATAFAPGATIVSTIRIAEGGFERRDLCEPCAASPLDAFSSWRTKAPETTEERRVLDLALAREFLSRLLRENDPARAALTYTLALLLARKRRARVTSRGRAEGGERVEIVLRDDEGEESAFEIVVPPIDEAETERVQEELTALLFGS